MAYIKNYRTTNNTIAGLPDTTNIQDAQLRLYLDRLNVSISTIVKTLNNQNTDIKSIIDALKKEKSFLDFITQEAGKEAGKEVEKTIKKNGIGSGTDKNKNLRSISISPSSLNIKPEESTETPLEVSYNPDDILNYQRGVTWSSSDENIATVDENGNVTSHQIGNCIIEAVSKYDTSISDRCYVYVAEGFDIFVFASNKWSNDSGGAVYTEMTDPEIDDPVWDTSDRITVRVPEDLTVNEAKKQAAYGLVSDVDNRDYFISDTGEIYWRYEYGDVDFRSGYEAIRTNPVYYAGYILTNNFGSNPSEVIFRAPHPETVEEDVTLFSNWYNVSDPSSVPDIVKEEYEYEKCLVEKNIKITDDSEVPVNVFISMVEYLEATGSPDDEDHEEINIIDNPRYIIETGESITLLGEKWVEISTFDGEYTAWISFDELEYLKSRVSYDRSGNASKSKPKVVDGYIDSDNMVELLSRANYGNNDVFKYDDVWYVRIAGYTGNDYVFKRKGNKFFAWSSDPKNSSAEIVYSLEEIPEKYGNKDGENFVETGSVNQFGIGAYSITVNEDIYYSTLGSNEV